MLSGGGFAGGVWVKGWVGDGDGDGDGNGVREWCRGD